MYDEDEDEQSTAVDIPDTRIVQRRGDSFDIGQMTPQTQQPTQPELIRILQNPNQLVNTLGLTPEQAENVRAIVTGAGAGVASKYLSQLIGERMAGAVGGFLGGFLSEKLLK